MRSPPTLPPRLLACHAMHTRLPTSSPADQHLLLLPFVRLQFVQYMVLYGSANVQAGNDW